METLLLHLLCFALLNVLLVFAGYLLLQKAMIWQSWVVTMLSIALIHFIFLHDHPILRMLAIIATTFSGMKVIAVAESYKGKPVTLTFKQWLAFSAWAGMRAQPFETLSAAPLPNAWPMVKFGISRIMAGALLILLAHGIVSLQLNHSLAHILVSGLLLVGFSLILHFGLLSISAGMWRRKGVNTYYLFKQPAKAISLTEFWSKRWNLAFSEMTSVAIFRPLRNKTGAPVALLLAFAFSGLLHELALSVPVNSGYGLPLLYFMIHGSLVLIEKGLISRKIMFLQNKLIAHVWVFFWLVIPAPLLFHTQFIKQIVWPLAGLSY